MNDMENSVFLTVLVSLFFGLLGLGIGFLTLSFLQSLGLMIVTGLIGIVIGIIASKLIFGK